jgi:hypothetical protein
MKKERSKATHDATWAGKYWGWHGAIRLAIRDFVLFRSNLSALSSTFYSASGASTGIRKYLCAITALKLSELFALTHLGNMYAMSPNERDIRGTILAMAGEYCPIGFLKRWYLNRAMVYARSVAYLDPSVEGMSEDAKYLTLVLIAKLYALTDLQYKAVHEADTLVGIVTLSQHLSPKVVTRVFRSLGTVSYICGDATKTKGVLTRSCRVAQDAELSDAVQKTEALAASYGITL